MEKKIQKKNVHMQRITCNITLNYKQFLLIEYYQDEFPKKWHENELELCFQERKIRKIYFIFLVIWLSRKGLLSMWDTYRKYGNVLPKRFSNRNSHFYLFYDYYIVLQLFYVDPLFWYFEKFIFLT